MYNAVQCNCVIVVGVFTFLIALYNYRQFVLHKCLTAPHVVTCVHTVLPMSSGQIPVEWHTPTLPCTCSRGSVDIYTC